MRSESSPLQVWRYDMSTINSPVVETITATRPTQVLRSGIVRSYLELTKAKLSSLVLVTTGAGFLLVPQNSSAPVNWSLFWWTILGTALAAGCANGLNEVMERRRDALMERTKNRPIPSGTMSPIHGFLVSLAMGYLGVTMLVLKVNLFAGILALVTVVLYVGVYTPLKPRTTLNTLVGALCGAIPPAIGWVGAGGVLNLGGAGGVGGAGGWLLVAILFVWQLPHFMALSWLYRTDYVRGGYRMLPVIDEQGVLTGRIAFLTALILLPLGLLVSMLQISGGFYAAGSLVLGLWFCFLCWRLAHKRTRRHARWVFIGSIVYLPLLLGLMLIDRV